MRMRTAAILPVKRFTRAKRRLGASISEELRADLARAMVGDVLVALSETAAIARTIVVTREDSVVAAAHHLGALVVADSAEENQSAAVAIGVATAIADGFERVLCIPGDCPALDPAELDALLLTPGDATPAADAARALARDAGGSQRPVPAVTIVPDRHGTGTNGLLLAPADAIAPSFGPDSCERHRARARAAGAHCRIERPASLLLDIDTGADLEALRERLAGERVRAPRTRAVLGLSGHTEALPIADAGVGVSVGAHAG
jgi:2-phospho-L-lactate guanylyltransferase